jgi:hypothetical protein
MVLTVPLGGGRLGRLESVRIRWVPLAVAAFAVQVMLVTVVPDGDTDLHRILHLATYALAAACLLRNLDVRFVWLVGVGGLLNLVAIAANGGVMPASSGALDRAGLEAQSGDFANSDLVDDAHVAFLGDVFAVPAGWPGANVFSVGDVLMLMGVFLAVHAAAGSRLAGPGRRRLPRSQGTPAAR